MLDALIFDAVLALIVAPFAYICWTIKRDEKRAERRGHAPR